MLRAIRQGVFPAVLTVLLLATAAAAGGREPGVLYQVSTIEALSAGQLGGERTVADVAGHGDFGLGTLDGLDGELVVLDGVFYQVTADGVVHVVPGEAKTPYVDLVFFKDAVDGGGIEGLSVDALKAALAAKLPDATRFYAVRVTGTFPELTVRSPHAQVEPYPTLAEALVGQSVFPLKNVTGTMVGIYAPPGAEGLAPTGFHLHFLTDDKKAGGHVLAGRTGSVRVAFCPVRTLTVDYPEAHAPRRQAAKPTPGTE